MIRASDFIGQGFDLEEIDVVASTFGSAQGIPGRDPVLAHASDMNLLLQSFERQPQA